MTPAFRTRDQLMGNRGKSQICKLDYACTTPAPT